MQWPVFRTVPEQPLDACAQACAVFASHRKGDHRRASALEQYDRSPGRHYSIRALHVVDDPHRVGDPARSIEIDGRACLGIETASDEHEDPNSLIASEMREFLRMMRSSFPQHFGMTCLGFATGLRPSSLRPLRRRGANQDVFLDRGIILVRRSQTVGDLVMNTTKTGKKTGRKQSIAIPPELVDVLRWHIEQLGGALHVSPRFESSGGEVVENGTGRALPMSRRTHDKRRVD